MGGNLYKPLHSGHAHHPREDQTALKFKASAGARTIVVPLEHVEESLFFLQSVCVGHDAIKHAGTCSMMMEVKIY